MRIWSELRRRNVLRMAALYLVAAWLILQVTEVLSGLIELPDWVGPLVLAMLAIGLPIALVLSWFFEITEAGISREAPEGAARKEATTTGRRLNVVIISMLAAGILVTGWLAWRPDGPVEKSIAVLAFDNMSDDPAQAYFSDGISEEILGTLAKVPELRVTSRSSSFSFKGKDFDLTIVSHTEPMDIGIYGRDDYYFQYADDGFKAIMTELNETTDEAARTSLMQDAQRKIAEDAVNVFLFQLAKTGVWNAKLKGLWENAPVQANDLTQVYWED